jgi:hypothetical protein
MASLLMERLHFVKGLDPVADAFAGATVFSDVINVKNLQRVLFVIHAGVGATGTSTITVQACDDVVPTNRVAIPFHYREILTGDTEGALTAVAATGFATTAGSSKIILVEVREDALSASGFGYVQLKAAEVVDSPVLGSILVIGESKIPGALKPTAIV